jgi:hypothetical protein
MLGCVMRQVNLVGHSLLGHHFGPLEALRTARITVVRKGSLREYRKLLNLRGWESQKTLVRKVQVLDHGASYSPYSGKSKTPLKTNPEL